MAYETLFSYEEYPTHSPFRRPCPKGPDGKPVFSSGWIVARVYWLNTMATVAECGYVPVAASISKTMNAHEPLVRAVNAWRAQEMERRRSKRPGFNLRRHLQLEQIGRRLPDRQGQTAIHQAYEQGTLEKWIEDTEAETARLQVPTDQGGSQAAPPQEAVPSETPAPTPVPPSAPVNEPPQTKPSPTSDLNQPQEEVEGEEE